MNTAANEVLDLVCSVVQRLEALQLSFFVTGSVGSSLLGSFRATNDIDIVCDLSPAQVTSFCGSFETDFFLDDEMARNAVQQRTSFNIIHKQLVLKVDFFPVKSKFERSALRRTRSVKIPGTDRSVRTASPEDLILAKLKWYKLGGCISERQLSDISGLVLVHGEKLDLPYLREWARELELSDLLLRLVDMGR